MLLGKGRDICYLMPGGREWELHLRRDGSDSPPPNIKQSLPRYTNYPGGGGGGGGGRVACMQMPSPINLCYLIVHARMAPNS